MKKIYEQDPWLMPYKGAIDARHEHIWQTLKHIAGDGLLKDAVNNHPFYGRLRSLRPKEDYIFQPNSMFYTIKDLYDYNPENYVAEQYLKAVVAMKQNSMRR